MHIPGRTYSLLTCLLTSLVLTGCGGDSNQRPRIDTIPAQSNAGGTIFTIDLSQFVTDETLTAAYSVLSGGGTFTGSVYTHMFPTLGTYNVTFQVADFRDEKVSGSFDVKITSAELALVRNGTGASLFDLKTANVMNALQDDGRTKTFRVALKTGGVVFEVAVAAQTDLWLFDPNVAATDVLAGDTNANETWALNTSEDKIVFVRGTAPNRSLHIYTPISKSTMGFGVTGAGARDERDPLINGKDVIYFESSAGGLADIHAYDVATNSVTAVSTHARDEDIVAVLADGGVVFRRKGAGGEWDLLYFNKGVGGVEIGADLGVTKGAESKDYKATTTGSRIVFETTDGGGDRDLYVWNPANGQTTSIGATTVDETFASLSGTGRVVYHIQTGTANKDVSQFDAVAGAGSSISAHAFDDTYKATVTTGDVIFARDTGATGLDLYRWSQGTGSSTAFPDAGGTTADQVFAKVIANDDVVYVAAGALSFFRPATGTSTPVTTAAGTESYAEETANGDFLINLVTGSSTHLYLWENSAAATVVVSTTPGVAAFQGASENGLILFSRIATAETTSNLFSFAPSTSTTVQITDNPKNDSVDKIFNALVN